MKNLPWEAKIRGAFSSRFLRWFFLFFFSIFFFHTLEIYQGLESSVGSHHRGTESKVHGRPSPWAFWSLPTPGQEIIIICVYQERAAWSERQHGKSQWLFSYQWGANFSCEAQAAHKFVFFQEEKKFKAKLQRYIFFGPVLHGSLRILVGP